MSNKNTEIIRIRSKDSQPLTKEQEAFNRLTKRIGTLTNKIEKERKKLDKLLHSYNSMIPEKEIELGECQMEIAALLHEATKKFNYSERQREIFRDVILYFCDEAFKGIIPDEEQEAIYDAWSHKTYKEEAEEDFEDQKEFMSSMFNSFGMDIDFSELEDNPESFAKFQEKLAEEFERREKEEPKFQTSSRKKTKKQIEKELLKKEEEKQQLKSVREIYIALVKVLHPDSSDNSVDRESKEELMKRLTEAYESKDLPTLLKLEMEWVAREQDNLSMLSEQKLKLYTAALKDRIKVLQADMSALVQHPRYHPISHWSFLAETRALASIKREAEQLSRLVEEVKADYDDLKGASKKRDFLNFSEAVLEELSAQDLGFDFYDVLADLAKNLK